jgi:GTP cyclohydrolase II
MVSTIIQTEFGTFTLYVKSNLEGKEVAAFVTQEFDPSSEVTLRIHSECLTGDVFHSLTCDCGPQKDASLKEIAKSKNGLFIYHRQEGRNMGLEKKIMAYNLMSKGVDTHEANIRLSGGPDDREYSQVIEIMRDLFVEEKPIIRLLSNNLYKKMILEREGYQVKLQPLEEGSSLFNYAYLETKRKKFMHYSNGYIPYIGVTLPRENIIEAIEGIIKMMNTKVTTRQGRYVFLGIPISIEDVSNPKLVKELNSASVLLKENTGVKIVFHLAYQKKRVFHRKLKKFLNLLRHNYSLQVRVKQKVDLNMIDDLGAEFLILQINGDQFDFLNADMIEYFQGDRKYVLYDNSFGKGRHEGIREVKIAVNELLDIGVNHIAVAGGYNKENIREITMLEDYFKIPISVDAETGIQENKKLNMSDTCSYLSNFFRVKI